MYEQVYRLQRSTFEKTMKPKEQVYEGCGNRFSGHGNLKNQLI
jgi:hypothetical protein